MPRRIIVDTNVLWDQAAVALLLEDEAAVVVPAVAYIERARQFRMRGRTVASLRDILAKNGFTIEDMAAEAGLRYAVDLEQATWDRHARDALIAGHVGPDDVLWTKNPKDFEKVGLARSQIRAL